jgi:hypothetical protein
LDVQCVEAIPYKIEADLYLDLELLIPLPEEKEYMVRGREKAQKEASARKPSNRPTKMTWTDDENNPQKVTTWKGLAGSVIHKALAEGLSPQELPMQTTSDPDKSKSEGFLSSVYFPEQKLYVSLHGSSDTIQGWIKAIISLLKKNGKDLGLRVDTANGDFINF